MNQEELLTIIDEEGNETLFEIVLTFRLEQFNKDYVCTTPISQEDAEEDADDEEVADLFVFSYTPDENGDHGNLEEITDDAEWAACEEVVNEFLEAEDLGEADEEEDLH